MPQMNEDEIRKLAHKEMRECLKISCKWRHGQMPPAERERLIQNHVGARWKLIYLDFMQKYRRAGLNSAP